MVQVLLLSCTAGCIHSWGCGDPQHTPQQPDGPVVCNAGACLGALADVGCTLDRCIMQRGTSPHSAATQVSLGTEAPVWRQQTLHVQQLPSCCPPTVEGDAASHRHVSEHVQAPILGPRQPSRQAEGNEAVRRAVKQAVTVEGQQAGGTAGRQAVCRGRTACSAASLSNCVTGGGPYLHAAWRGY
jgi:hypothetical protein